jgi:hypothetical protein
MNRPATVEEIDSALTECSRRLKRAQAAHDAEAEIVYQRQQDRLFAWRRELLAATCD